MDDIFVKITDGKGSGKILNGKYYVDANAPYYQLMSVSPNEIEITDDQDTYDFTVKANGNLAIQVTDDGTSSGEKIQGATFYRCTADGTHYGEPAITNQMGALLFSNVPVDETIPPTIYVVQTSSDGAHSFDTSVQSIQVDYDYKLVNLSNPKL